MSRANKFTPFPELFQSVIIDNLSRITIANGFENDLNVLPGWLTHYYENLKKGGRFGGLPAAVAHADNETNQVNRAAYDDQPVTANNTRQITIECAVDDTDPRQVFNQLESVLRDIKAAISRDSRLTLTGSTFIVNKEISAVNISAEIKYNEKWELSSNENN